MQVQELRGFLMNKFSNSTFTNTVVRIDHGEYKNCLFDSCTIEYGGEGPISLVGCTFRTCNWKLVGHAINTIMFLQTMYSNMGEFGQAMVENTFNSIKGARNPV